MLTLMHMANEEIENLGNSGKDELSKNEEDGLKVLESNKDEEHLAEPKSDENKNSPIVEEREIEEKKSSPENIGDSHSKTDETIAVTEDNKKDETSDKEVANESEVKYVDNEEEESKSELNLDDDNTEEEGKLLIDETPEVEKKEETSILEKILQNSANDTSDNKNQTKANRESISASSAKVSEEIQNFETNLKTASSQAANDSFPAGVSKLPTDDNKGQETVLPTDGKTEKQAVDSIQNCSAIDKEGAACSRDKDNSGDKPIPIDNIELYEACKDNEDKKDNEDADDDGEIDDDGDVKGERKEKNSDSINGSTSRKSQRVVTSIIRRSIRCLNKMHATENSSTGEAMKTETPDKDTKPTMETNGPTVKVPQSQQNGAALPEEAAVISLTDGPIKPKLEPQQIPEPATVPSPVPRTTRTPSGVQKAPKQEPDQQRPESARKRRVNDSNNLNVDSSTTSRNGASLPKKMCLEQREQFINSLIGSDKYTAEQLAARAEQLKAEVQDLDELARAKEMEWNEILSMRKLKEEAFLRIERRRQILGFMESNGQVVENLPPASLSLNQMWENITQPLSHMRRKNTSSLPTDDQESLPVLRKDKPSKFQSHFQQSIPLRHNIENGPKLETQNMERHIGEGRQGPIVDVRSIIADYRLRHPDTVPRRRGRRMKNSVNVGLGAGGAMVENIPMIIDSRPSSTDSCKSNSNISDPNNAMSFKDVLVQFAKLSQQQGEPIKTPQNYPDVTLHPVQVTTAPQNTTSQSTGSLLHGILTKSQSPRPTTFSPTLAKLLTAPERERSTAAMISNPHHNIASAQHLLQAYQSTNPVSITDFLSSSKARTEITITPVSNPLQSHQNNLITVDDAEDEAAIMDDRDSRLSAANRDGREDRDTPPRCQGCHERAAQFVCAGCGNQWYCSRECQVAAWDDHSEVCSG